MRLLKLILIFSIFINSFVFSETNNNQLRKAILNKYKSLSQDDFIKMQTPKRNNKQLSEEALQILQKNSTNNEIKLQSNPLPTKFRTPAEFEEVQAVLVSWPSYAFDKDTNWLDPFTPGIGVRWDPVLQKEVFVPIEFWVLDLFEDSPYPQVWASLIDAIQPEAVAWIRVAAPQDTSYLKGYLQSIGKPLYNYKFIYDPDGENAFWMRDFGPYGIYYGDNDSLGFVNAQYYPFRAIDNKFPEFLSNKLGLPIWNFDVETEGGNFITDGHNNIWYSSVIYGNNADQVGPGMVYKKPMSSTEVNNLMKEYFNASNSTILDHLYCDGGTGHVDLYLKMLDDETFMIANFPAEFNVDTFPDYQIISKNRNILSNQKSFADSKLHFLDVPIPTLDNGTYGKIGCYGFNSDARNYINGLTVNKTFIMPIYSNDINGNKVADNLAIDYMQKRMQGYKIYPIDVRALSPLGGAIHCVTMQIPAENPVHFTHKKYKGNLFPIPSDFFIETLIKNHSGIKNATVYWKKNSLEKLNSMSLIKNPQIEDYYFQGIILEDFKQGDTITYFIKAETNNGKIAYHPITAPEGGFQVVFDNPTSVEQINNFGENFDITALYPNPVIDASKVKFEISNDALIELYLVNSIGEKVLNIAKGYYSSGEYLADLNVDTLPNGMYVLVLKSNTSVKSKKILINN